MSLRRYLSLCESAAAESNASFASAFASVFACAPLRRRRRRQTHLSASLDCVRARKPALGFRRPRKHISTSTSSRPPKRCAIFLLRSDALETRLVAAAAAAAARTLNARLTVLRVAARVERSLRAPLRAPMRQRANAPMRSEPASGDAQMQWRRRTTFTGAPKGRLSARSLACHRPESGTLSRRAPLGQSKSAPRGQRRHWQSQQRRRRKQQLFRALWGRRRRSTQSGGGGGGLINGAPSRRLRVRVRALPNCALINQ